MKSALEIVAYTNSTETEGTIALLEVAIAALNRSGFTECADMADLALHKYVEETLLKVTGQTAISAATMH